MEMFTESASRGLLAHTHHRTTWELVGLRKNRLQKCLSGPYFAAFLDHSPTMGRRNRHNLASLSHFFAFDSPSPTGSLYIFLPFVSCGLASVWAHLGATGLAGEKTGLIDLSLLILDEWDSFSGEIGYRKRV
jgi:hypothetical protein